MILRVEDLRAAISNLDGKGYICVGKEDDELGRYEMRIDGLKKRYMGFEQSDQPYYVLTTKAFDCMGAMKFMK